MLRRPNIDRTFQELAAVWAKRSTCRRASVGAVIALDGRSVSSGYNGAPAGLQHCRHLPEDGSPCTLAVHAEANAIVYAARYGIPLSGSTLYTTMAPCYACALLIISAGIVRVVASSPYRKADGPELLAQSGIQYVMTAKTRGGDST